MDNVSLSLCKFELYVFFFNDTSHTEIYTLSLHDALPIFRRRSASSDTLRVLCCGSENFSRNAVTDRKSTRLNSSHMSISYAVFCLKKKRIQYVLTWFEFQKDPMRKIYADHELRDMDTFWN